MMYLKKRLKKISSDFENLPNKIGGVMYLQGYIDNPSKVVGTIFRMMN